MKKSLLIALLLLSVFSIQYSVISAQTQNVVRLESLIGSDEDYAMAELQRVEFIGDSIRFFAKDGSLSAEVYKYDYIKLVIAEKEDQAIEEPTANSQKLTAKKIIRNGQVYVLFGDKVYCITGQQE